MKLKFVLFVLSLKMRNALKNNELFLNRLKSRTGSVLIRTADRSAGRLFVFSKGNVFTKSQSKGNADVQMIWKDENKAFKSMTSKNPQALTDAMDVGDLQIEGDLSIAQWFGLLVKAMKSKEKTSKQYTLDKVAVIGLGKMGSGIATNIQNTGYDLIVYNRTSEKAKVFTDKGAVLADSPAQAAKLAKIVITSLMDDASVKNIVTAKNGILAGLSKGGIHLCATTISPELAKELTILHNEHGSHFVTGAVVGRPDAAKAGELLTLIAGDKESVNKSRAVCASYSAASLVIGEEPYMANYAKLSANYFAVANMELMGQLYAFGDVTGIGRDFYSQIFESSYANPILKFYAQKIRNKDFNENVGFELSGGLKDVRLMQQSSNECSGSLDYAPIIISKMEQALTLGYDKYDWSVFTEMSNRK